MALSVEEKLQIMEKALREGYDGYMTDLWAQADPEEAAMAQPTFESDTDCGVIVDL